MSSSLKMTTGSTDGSPVWPPLVLAMFSLEHSPSASPSAALLGRQLSGVLLQRQEPLRRGAICCQLMILRPSRLYVAVDPQQVAESLAVGQVHQRLPVVVVGPHSSVFPAPHSFGIGPEAAGNLRPRQTRFIPEPLQALREVVGEDVGSSAVMCALSRHGISAPRAQP